jgi:hypothetical protein
MARTSRPRPATVTIPEGVTPEAVPTVVDVSFAIRTDVVSAQDLANVGAYNMTPNGMNVDGQQCFLVTREGLDRLARAGWVIGAQQHSSINAIELTAITAGAAPAPAAPAAPAPAAPEAAPAAPQAAAPAAAAPAVAATAATAAPAKPATAHKVRIGTMEASAVVVTPKGWTDYTIATDAGFRDSVLKAFKDILGAYVKRNIDVYIPHGRAQAPIAGDTFNVFIWSAPDAGGPDSRFVVPETMWGHQVTERPPGHFVPWEQGGKIMSAEGDEVGYFNDNNLYITFDAVHAVNDGKTLTLLKTYLTEAVKIMTRGYRPPNYRDLCEKYVAVSMKRFEIERKNAVENVKKEEEALAAAKRQIIESTRNIEHLQAIAEARGLTTDQQTAKLTKEFVALRELAHVANVTFKGDVLTVETDPLYVTDPRVNKLHAVGCMRININTTNGDVKMFAIGKTVDAQETGMQAPHVFSSGKPCWGNIGSTVTELVASFEYKAAIVAVILYLQSVNVDDSAGSKVNRWPVADPEVVKAQRAALAIEKKARYAAELAEYPELAEMAKPAAKAAGAKKD